MLLRIALLIVLLVGGGCLKTPQLGPGLPELTDDFCEAMRWKDFTSAAGYLNPDVRDEFSSKFKEDKDLYIVGSKFRSVNIHLDEQYAEALYILEYYRLPSSRIREWRWTQRWQLISEGMAKADVWRISNPPPEVPWQQ